MVEQQRLSVLLFLELEALINRVALKKQKNIRHNNKTKKIDYQRLEENRLVMVEGGAAKLGQTAHGPTVCQHFFSDHLSVISSITVRPSDS